MIKMQALSVPAHRLEHRLVSGSHGGRCLMEYCGARMVLFLERLMMSRLPADVGGKGCGWR